MSATLLISRIRLSHMVDPGADQTYERLVTVFNNVGPAPLRPAAQTFAEKAAAYSEVLHKQSISPLTDGIQLSTSDRDRALTVLFRSVANALLSPDAATRAAAHQCDTILRSFGNPARRPMDTQTNVTKDILETLNAPDTAPALARLPVAKAAADSLAAINASFAAAFDQRIAERNGRETGAVRRARKQADAAARDIISKINAYIILFGDAGLADTVASANSILDDAKHLINRRAGQRHRHDGGESAESDSL